MAKRRKPKAQAVSAAVTAAPAWLRHDVVWALVLLALVVAAYVPVCYAGFIWDDDDHLTANPCIVGPLGFWDIWTSQAADISPLTRSTFWLEHAIWGLVPWPYHVVNVLLHGACAIVLWKVLQRLAVPGAWFGAALWALHPVQVESVAWVTEMKNTESGLFYLLAILFFLRWREKTAALGNYFIALALACAAMACKSSTVVLPVVLMLIAWWQERRWRWTDLRTAAPFFIPTLAASALSLWTQDQYLALLQDPLLVRTWPQRIATAGDAVWFYLGKLIWPQPLMAVYPRWQPDASSPIAYLPTLAVIVVLVIFWLKRDGWARPWFFAFAYFLVALAPVLGLIDNPLFIYSLVFDHLQYLASMGPLVLAGAGLARLAELRPTIPRWLPVGLGIASLAVLAVASWQHTWVFQSEKTLWTDDQQKNPESWIAEYNLGNMAVQAEQPDVAEAHYRRALQIYPNYPGALNNLGNILRDQGRIDEALELYNTALKFDPMVPTSYFNIGAVYAGQGRLDEAAQEFRLAIARRPFYADAHDSLGGILAREGRPEEARLEFQAAIAAKPNDAQAHNNLGELDAEQGKLDQALAEYRTAIALKPDYAEAHKNIGNILRAAGQLDDAAAEYEKALAINPNSADVRERLADIQLHSGKVDDAISQYQQALAIRPAQPDMVDALGIALQQKGDSAGAIAQFQKAISLAPDNAAFHCDLGLVYGQSGQLDNAIDEERQAVTLNPDMLNAHVNLGAVLLEKGRVQEAIDQFQAALRLNPNDANALSNLSRAQAMAAHGAK